MKDKSKIIIISVIVGVLIILSIVFILLNIKPKLTYIYYVNNIESEIPSGTLDSYNCDNGLTLEYNEDTKEFTYEKLTKNTTCRLYYNSTAGNYIYSLGTTEKVYGSLYLDTSNNMRYYGSDPANYIYFNCSDYSNQNSDTCDIYRILGVIKDYIDGEDRYYLKIVSNNKLIIDNNSLFSWHINHNDNSNTYTNSSIYKLLNEGYLYSTKEYNYTDKDGNKYTFDLSNIGIKNNNTRNMIDSSMWKLSNDITSDTYISGLYANELSGEKLDNVFIGLLSISDYILSKGSSCNNISISNIPNCSNDTYIKYEEGLWTLNTVGNNRAYRFLDNGALNGVYITVLYEIYPVMYLDYNIKIVGGVGTIDNPYQLSI